MKTSITKITPAMARNWIAHHNEGNRVLRPAHVAALKGAMDRGEFKVTHQGIAFDPTGNLIDGQHRLTALSLMHEGFYLYMMVTTGIDRSAYEAIDGISQRRNTADVHHVDRAIGQVANFLARVYGRMGANSLSAAYTGPFVHWVEPEMALLLTATTTTARIWSSAGARAAAVITMKMQPEAVEYVTQTYKVMVLQDYQSMSPTMAIHNRLGNTGTKVMRRTNEADIFLRCLRLYDPTKTDLRRILVRDPVAELEALRTYLRAEVPDIFVPKSAPVDRRASRPAEEARPR